MSAKITIKETIDAIQVDPLGLQFGISQDLTRPPLSHQMSNQFPGLENGTYYIWYKTPGSPWLTAQTKKTIVNC